MQRDALDPGAEVTGVLADDAELRGAPGLLPSGLQEALGGGTTAQVRPVHRAVERRVGVFTGEGHPKELAFLEVGERLGDDLDVHLTRPDRHRGVRAPGVGLRVPPREDATLGHRHERVVQEPPQNRRASVRDFLAAQHLHVLRLATRNPAQEESVGYPRERVDLAEPVRSEVFFVRVFQVPVVPEEEDLGDAGVEEWSFVLEKDLVHGAKHEIFDGLEFLVWERRFEEVVGVVFEDPERQCADDLVRQELLTVGAVDLDALLGTIREVFGGSSEAGFGPPVGFL